MSRGLFVTGTDTGVGKTYVGALIAHSLRERGYRVGVYKPAASDCEYEGDRLMSADASILWQAAGEPGELAQVCPQCFQAPLAPHLAAQKEGSSVDEELLRTGIATWVRASEVVIVEGVGGLMSPVGPDTYNADLAEAFGYPLVVVAPNALGAINQTLQTLIAAAAWGDGLPIAGVVLNQNDSSYDPSRECNRAEIESRSVPPILTELKWQADRFVDVVNWYELARGSDE